jgi:L-threonine kinase
VGFNRRPKDFSVRDLRAYESLLAVLSVAIAVGDVETIGRVATQSARMNQRLCPKRSLEDMIGICQDHGGLGVVAAHSGTALGILLANAAPGHHDRLHRTELACARLSETVWVDRCLPVAHGGPAAAVDLGYQPVGRRAPAGLSDDDAGCRAPVR